MDQLQAYKWPGNVRELQNLIERALIRDTDGILRFHDLIQPQQASGTQITENAEQPILSLDEVNARYLRQVLARTHGKINDPGGAAALLEIHPNTLRKRLAKLGIPYKRKERT